MSLLEDVSIPSLRYLSAYLRSNGHDTTLILLPWAFTDSALSDSNSFLYPYSDTVLGQVAEICGNADLVGISMMTCHFDNAVHVTKFLRKHLQVPIIWGGIHPTLRPAECLEYADMVCVGEGETSMGQLAAEMSGGKAWQSLAIPGIHHRHNMRIAPSPLVENLDELPLPDYGLDHQFIFYKGNIVGLDNDLLVRCLGHSYRTLFSRGCPYACTYCCNYALRELYQPKIPVRWRSLDKRIEELRAAKKLMPDLEEITLADDAFLAQPLETIKSFADRYREEIGLPLNFITTPRSLTEAKLAPLAEAGLYIVGIGIQSGSERIVKELYSRPESIEELLSASVCISQVAQKQKRQIIGRYDFILDNPWETEQDVEASIRLGARLKKPYFLALFSLTFYPETELYRKAQSEGLITDDLNQVYRRSQLAPKHTYLNGVFAALSANAPRWVIKLLLWKRLRRRSLVWFPYLVASAFELLKLLRGFFGYAIRGDWHLIRFLLRWAWLKMCIRSATMHSNGRAIFCGAPGEFCIQDEKSPKYEVQVGGNR